MTPLVVIPMKDPAQAKTRLTAALTSHDRERLALLLFENTLSFFCQVYPHLPLLVVTESEMVAALSREHRAQVLKEAGQGGLNAALNAAADWAMAHHYPSILIAAADVAVWEKCEVDRFLLAGQDGSVVIAESIDGGTNALLLPRPHACAFRYGPGSALLHEIAAKESGSNARRIQFTYLARDVDTPDDLALCDLREERQLAKGPAFWSAQSLEC